MKEVKLQKGESCEFKATVFGGVRSDLIPSERPGDTSHIIINLTRDPCAVSA